MASSTTTTWVDRLHMRPIPTESASPPPPSDSIEFNIVSFNVLAESYLTPRSHPGLPTAYAEVAFDKNNRRKLLVDTLKRFCDPSSAHHTNKWDILAIQELDLLADDEEILPALKSWGYEVVHTPADQRKDCCAVVFDKKKFRLVGYEVIKFDDLATLYANADQETKLKDGTTFNNVKPNRTNSELTGMVRSFLRRNCAILAQLENIWTSGTDKQSILVASVHLYWHPGYEYVKLCQAKYLMDRAHAMSLRNSGQGERIPTVICGDMNSKPGSIVHQYFVKGNVNAQSVAPWNYFWSADDEIIYCEDADDRLDGQDAVKSSFGDVENGTAEISEHDVACDTDVHNGITGLEEQFQFCQFIAPNTSQDKSKTASDINSNYSELQTTLAARRANNHISPQDYTHTTPTPSVKYMLDFTLNRFTRWLRILGIDARLETEEEEKERTTGQNIVLFDHCKQQGRTLLTTSYKLLLRKDCPPGAYLLDPKSIRHLEEALPRLLRTHGVELSPCTFLTRCVVCNGNINRVSTDEEKRRIFTEHGAPDLVNAKEEMEVFKCDNCSQGYWWDDRPSSSASRVFEQATKLFRLCLRGGVRIKNDGLLDDDTGKEVMGAFRFVDVKKERECTTESAHIRETDLAVIEWLREEKLANPFDLCSAYSTSANSTCPGEVLPFSNITSEFVGLLDYVLYDEQFEQLARLNIPTSFRDMNTLELPKGHLIPSDIWPSDHLAVGGRLRLKRAAKPDASTTSLPLPSHPPRCACGCVPNILSLFEMAELRKKAREAAKK